MTTPAGLDVRLPIGALFVILGALLALYGLFSAGTAGGSSPLVHVNVNLWWGVAMFAFGTALLVAASRSVRHRTAEPRVQDDRST